MTAELKTIPVNGWGSRRRLRNLDGTFIFFLSHFSPQGRPHGLILHQEYADDFLEAVDLCLPIFDGRLLPAGREISMIRFGIHKVLPTVLDIIRARNHAVHGRRAFVLSTSPRCSSCSRPHYSSVAKWNPSLLEHRWWIDVCGRIGEAEGRPKYLATSPPPAECPTRIAFVRFNTSIKAARSSAYVFISWPSHGWLERP